MDGVQHGFLPGLGRVAGGLGVPVGAIFPGEGGGILGGVIVVAGILVGHREGGELVESL